jgi:hypothetical protein
MNDILNVNVADMLSAFDEIQMPRTEYHLKKLLIGSGDTEADRYAHCVLEMMVKWDDLRLVKLHVEIKEIEIAELIEKGDKVSLLNAEIKKIELEQTNRARLGAMREFKALYRMWLEYPHKYTRNEMDADQPEYWNRRITRQVNQDILATGRVGQGNQDMLRALGKSTIPALDVIRDVERRFIASGEKSRMLIAVATEHKVVDGLPCLEHVDIPQTTEHRLFNVHSRPVADAYNVAAQQAIEDNADWLVTIEDDTFPPSDAIIRLLEYAENNPKTAIGAWYPQRTKTRMGTPIVSKNGKRKYLDADGEIHEVLTLPMGCSIYPISMFLEIPRPWFETTKNITQDSFFSQLAREHGYKLLVDTSIRCKHIDRVTGEVFE